MNGLAFDTLKVSKELRELGFSDIQAEGLSSLLNTAVVSDLVTKDYFRTEIRRLEDKLTIRMGGIVMAGIAFLKALDYLL